MTKNTKKALALALLLAGCIAGAASYVLYTSSTSNKEAVSMYIDSDDNEDSVRTKIINYGNLSSDWALDIYSSALSLNEHIRTGHYVVEPEMKLLQLIRNIRNHQQQPVRLVVPSVRTMEEMSGRLSRMLMLDSATIANCLTNAEELSKIGYTSESIPSLFIPNTYEVYWDITVNALIERMKKENNAFWNEREAKLKEVSEYAGQTMDKLAVVTMASIVDSETANNSEKANIAGLYLNRLRIGMPLQSDPTVKFALKAFGLRRILHEHLTVDSPYNTYKNTGLPPGPICVPSIAGIDAVLNHAHNDYIYMCAKEDFSGTHNFAVSYAEHLQNARRYTQALNARNIH